MSTTCYELIVHPATPASEAKYDELTTCVESSSPYPSSPSFFLFDDK